jgi:hypothetical protein
MVQCPSRAAKVSRLVVYLGKLKMAHSSNLNQLQVFAIS